MKRPPTRLCCTDDDKNTRFRAMVRKSRRGEAGYALGYGLRIGYWPCLHAPYVQIVVHHWRLEIWDGLPSYRDWK
jgi:hypothetical protein